MSTNECERRFKGTGAGEGDTNKIKRDPQLMEGLEKLRNDLCSGSNAVV